MSTVLNEYMIYDDLRLQTLGLQNVQKTWTFSIYKTGSKTL